jgi:hypothetical protein
VLDFIIGSDGVIWVLLDEQWGESTGTGKMVRVVRWDPVAGEVRLCPCLSQKRQGPSFIMHLRS